MSNIIVTEKNSYIRQMCGSFTMVKVSDRLSAVKLHLGVSYYVFAIHGYE